MSAFNILNITDMYHTFKPAIIGGTGKSGQYLVKSLAGKAIRFNMLVRNPEHLPTKYPQAEIVYGNVLKPEAIDLLLEGCDVVISTLGLGVPPSQPDLFSHATANLLEAMAAHGIKRYIAVTGLNVDAPSDRKSAQRLRRLSGCMRISPSPPPTGKRSMRCFPPATWTGLWCGCRVSCKPTTGAKFWSASKIAPAKASAPPILPNS